MAGITKESLNAIISLVDGPVMELMRDVIKQEDNCQILQTDLRRMENLLQDMITIFRDEVDIAAFIQDYHEKAFLEMVKTWLQLLHNSLTEAERLLSIDNWGTRQRCVDWIVNNPRRPSKQIRHWNACFDHLYRSFQSDFSILVTSLQFVSAKPLYKEEALLQGVAASGFIGSGIKDAQAQVERWLTECGQIHVIGVCGTPGVGKTSLLGMLYKHEVSNDFYEKLWVTVPQDCNSFDLQDRIIKQIPHIFGLRGGPASFDERKMKLSAYLKKKNFLLVLDDLFSRLDLQEVGVAFGDGKHSKVLFSTCRKDLIGEIGAEEFIEIQPLSQDEACMLFRRVAFKDDQVPVDIEERARNVADECKGVPLTINVVGAAMIGKTSAHEWDICLASMRNVDSSFPAATPASYLDAQLYARLRYGYDALPNSDVKRCFLYCAMYKKGEEIDTHTLLQMWIGEGLVKSKQGTYLMDMALKLLVNRRLFQKVKQSTNVFKQRTIRVVHNCIHDMAVYIGQTEENFLFMPSQHQRNFPVVHDENCSRMSVASNSMEHLPTELRCPKLASLSLQGISHLKELPSDFLPSMTSLRVLNLSGCIQITSIPTSIGQLRMLQFLSLQRLSIEDLPKEICQLSKLQFLDLSGCRSLNSLPSQIGELRNLKHLNLYQCSSLKMIPREMSELTSLSRLQVYIPDLSVEMEARASIWSLKGLKSLTELKIWIDTRQQDRKRSRIKDGIMGNWSEMRHLQLLYDSSNEEDLLPEDMQNMKKLQSFVLSWYKGLSLPNCKFEHLEMVTLYRCDNIRELSPLERLPNLKLLKLRYCNNLRELGIGSPNGYVRLQKLVLRGLKDLEYLDGASKRRVWDERTLPQLRVLKIRRCPSLKTFPKGMEKLRDLSALMSSEEWWESIMWEDDDMKGKLQKFFIPREAGGSKLVLEREKFVGLLGDIKGDVEKFISTLLHVLHEIHKFLPSLSHTEKSVYGMKSS